MSKRIRDVQVETLAILQSKNQAKLYNMQVACIQSKIENLPVLPKVA